MTGAAGRALAGTHRGHRRHGGDGDVVGAATVGLEVGFIDVDGFFVSRSQPRARAMTSSSVSGLLGW